MCRYLDDVSLHHLINALCSLSLEAMEMAYGNNKVEHNGFVHFIISVLYTSFQMCNLILSYLSVTTNILMHLTSSGSVFLLPVCVSGAISVCCGQAAGDWPCQHGPH